MQCCGIKPRSYYWGKLQKVFADDVEDDVTSAEFTFMQRKRLTVDPTQIRYGWPMSEDIDIVDVERCFYGPVMPVLDKNLYKFDSEIEVSRLFAMKC